MRDRRRHDLARRKAEERSLRCHLAPGLAVGQARDGVDHKRAVVVNRNLQTDFGSGVNEFVEDALNFLLQ